MSIDTTTSEGHSAPAEPPTPSELRAELQRMIVADLLGPVGGEDEELPGRGQVRDRYLVGALAPKGSIGVDPERNAEPVVEGDAAPDLPGEVPDTDQSAAQASMFPSSIGLSCVVVPEVTELVLTASWGQYVKEVRELEELGDETGAPSGATAAARPARVWQRYPVEGEVVIPLTEGVFGPFSVAAGHPGVVVRGRVSKREDFSLVSAFLVNEQDKAATNSDERWLFQATFMLAAPGGDGALPAFVGRDVALFEHGVAGSYGSEDEVALLELQYRNHIEFATGHGTAVHAVMATDAQGVRDPTRARRLETRVIPSFEVPRTEAPTAEEEPMLSGAVLDMAALARTPQSGLRAALEPLVGAYEAWIDNQAIRPAYPDARLGGHEAAIEVALLTARQAAARIRAGIDVLVRDPDAAEAFSFANEAMWQQRIRTVATAHRPASDGDDDAHFELAAALTDADLPANRSWRPFQLAFILLNIPALTDPTHPERLHDSGLVDLLFFPTGGGKTEAYLGLTAFTLAIRRLQGTVAGHGPEGVAVLMRYTLRLLTSDQFSRASALICACEVIRRAKVVDDSRWGDTPFRIGLWVGSSLTPNRGKESQAAIEEQRSGKRVRGSQPVILTSCPWCGRRLDTGADARYDPDRWRTLVFCGDPLGQCAFTEGASNKEGLPVVTVDEEIYRLLPALLISTADKWAQLPLKGPLHLLFGRVARRCERHGYRSAELDVTSDRTEADKHNKTAQLPAAKTLDCDPLRPPDLIIQDELHLLAGPLGTLVGLYESVIDELASWEVGETTVRPKVIASTATVRRAAQQVHALFWRGLSVFPPPVLDVEDSFFARQRAVASDGADGEMAGAPGRLYLGICAPGQRMASVETRVFTTVLAASQVLYERYGAAADPWMTMVAYFSALRELGGAKRLVDDDVRSRLRNADKRGLAQRSGMIVRELTSRISSGEVGGRLDELMVRFDPNAPKESAKPIDVLLATNMISVGVDVARLGLMVCVGQPKATAEYIQATSRVGRTDAGPGLVVSLYNWARPRDFSHYETFEHYHGTFYRQVEALSVTPFAIRALDRGLTAVFVALLRQHLGSVANWNPNNGAQAVMTTGHPVVSEAIDRLATRAENVSGKPGMAAFVRAQLQQRLDEWAREQLKAAGGGATLGYQDKATVVGLLSTPTVGDWPLWAVPNSLREVEPTINLIIDERDWSIEHPRPWAAPGTGGPAPSQPTVEDPDPGSEAEFTRDLLGDADTVAP